MFCQPGKGWFIVLITFSVYFSYLYIWFGIITCRYIINELGQNENLSFRHVVISR